MREFNIQWVEPRLVCEIAFAEWIPEFDYYYVVYLKDDPAKEPIAASYSGPGVSPKQRIRPAGQKRSSSFARSRRRSTSGLNRCFSDVSDSDADYWAMLSVFCDLAT